MIPGNDADDMVRRGFFSSLLSFRRKSVHKTERTASPAAPRSRQPTTSQIPPEQARAPCPLPPISIGPSSSNNSQTPNDIFREIVTECAQIERSGSNTPFSEYTSTPSPVTPNLPQSPQFEPAHPQVPAMTFPPTCQPLYDPMMAHYAPPPYSTAEMPMFPGAPTMYPQPMMMPAGPDGQSILIEEVVKMVVNAMKQSTLVDQRGESPEEILRRKRAQNNEAAARYRKRQRVAREKAEEELFQLSKRNEELRLTVSNMEHEINELKKLVLQKNS